MVGRSLSHADRTPCLRALGSRPLRPELAAPLGVWPSFQLAVGVHSRQRLWLYGIVAVLVCCMPSGSRGRPSGLTNSATLLADELFPCHRRPRQGCCRYCRGGRLCRHRRTCRHSWHRRNCCGCRFGRAAAGACHPANYRPARVAEVSVLEPAKVLAVERDHGDTEDERQDAPSHVTDRVSVRPATDPAEPVVNRCQVRIPFGDCCCTSLLPGGRGSRAAASRCARVNALLNSSFPCWGATMAYAAVDVIQDKVSRGQLVKVDNIAVHQRSLPAISTARRHLDENGGDSRPSARRL